MRIFAILVLLSLAALGCEKESPTAPKTSADTGTQASPTSDTGQSAEVAPEPVAPDVRTIFSFVDNRHLAHFIDAEGALLMDMGSASSLKYIQGGWNSTWIAPKKEAASQSVSS